MKRILRHRSQLPAASLIAVLCLGCASTPRQRPGQTPFYVSGAEGLPLAVVHGDLIAWLNPAEDRTPWLERVLYGEPQAARPLLRNPQGMATHGDRLYVCDQGIPDVMVIDLRVQTVRPFCALADRPPCPVAAAVDDAGRVYVADPTRGAVLAYSPEGRLDETLVPPHRIEPPATAAEPFRPVALAFDRGTLFIGDSGAGRIVAFHVAEQAWSAFPPPPSSAWPLLSPTGIAVAADGNLLVADSMIGVIHRFDPSGTWLGVIGAPGRGPGQFVRLKQLVVTPGGWIAAVDAARQSVVIFDARGDHLGEIGAVDADGTRWTLPAGVASLAFTSAPEPTEGTPGGASTRELLIVSDAMGGTSLTVIELTTHARPSRVARPSDAGA